MQPTACMSVVDSVRPCTIYAQSIGRMHVDKKYLSIDCICRYYLCRYGLYDLCTAYRTACARVSARASPARRLPLLRAQTTAHLSEGRPRCACVCVCVCVWDMYRDGPQTGGAACIQQSLIHSGALYKCINVYSRALYTVEPYVYVYSRALYTVEPYIIVYSRAFLGFGVRPYRSLTTFARM
jgi:hypothetical protein